MVVALWRGSDLVALIAKTDEGFNLKLIGPDTVSDFRSLQAAEDAALRSARSSAVEGPFERLRFERKFLTSIHS